MKILLISDTHNDRLHLKHKILPKYADEIQMAVHLGDFAVDLISAQGAFPGIKMAGVGGSFEFDEETEHIFEVGDGEFKRRILLLHGHTVDVKSGLNRLVNYARQKEVHACFFGHTHVPVILEESGIFFMNPGSLTNPPSGKNGSYGLVTVSPEGKFYGEVIES